MKHSPFAFFRKHQRIGMVILTVAAMFAFVFLDGINRYSGSGYARGAGNIAVKVSGADLTQLDLAQLRAQRQVINSFIARVLYTVSTADEDNKKTDQQINELINGNLFGIEWGNPNDDVALVWAHIMRQEAYRLGLSITDPMIDAYIRRMHENKLTADQFATILSSEGLRQKQLYEGFRQELLARNAWRMSRPVIDQTPEQYWHYYRKLKVHQNLEVAALPVSEFAKGVKAPADSVLEKFFEDHKRRYPNEGLKATEPGFRQPAKVMVQYLSASYEEVEKTVTPPTDKEITDFYEKNKATMYRDFEKPTIPSENDPLNPEVAPERPSAPKTPEDATPAPSAPKKEATEQPKDKPADTPADKPAEKPVEQPKDQPAEEKPAEEQKAEEKPAEEKKEEKPAESPPADGEEKPCGSDCASDSEAEQSEPAKTEAPAKATEEKAAEDKPAAEAAAKEPAETKPAEPKAEPADAKAADKPDADKTEKPAAETKPADPKADSTKPAKEGEAKGAADDFKSEPEVIKYQPLTKELKENIGEQLLMTKTTEAIFKKGEAALKELEDRNLKYNLPVTVKGNIAFIDFNEDGEINRDTTLNQDEPQVESKEPLDPNAIDKIPAVVTAELKQKVNKLAAAELQRVGKKLGLKYSSTEMLSEREIDEMPGLGKVEVGANPDQFQPDNSQPILQVLFGKEQLYDAAAGQDSEEKGLYVFWKVDASKSHVPTFTEPGIKELVLEAWKQEQAYPETLKRAEQLAKLVGKQTLKVALDGQTVNNSKDGLPIQVHETGDFSWMSPGTPSPNMFENPPVYGAPDFVKTPGEEFMKAACEDLAIGETGVAPNRDHSVIYVLRVINREPKPGEETDRLRQTFMKERLFGILPGIIPSAYTYIARDDEYRLYNNWMEGLKKKYAVEFVGEDRTF